MGHLSILSRAEIESMGPPTPEELSETGVHEAFLCDLALKHVAMLPEPTTISVADRLHLPRALTEELLYHLYREKLIEMRLQSAVGATRYAMLDHGWERVQRLQNQSGYLGPAPVSLDDYAHMMRLQAVPSRSATMETVRNAFKDLVLPDSLLQTLGCVINSRSSLFLTGLARHRQNCRLRKDECEHFPVRSGFLMRLKLMARSFASTTHTAIEQSSNRIH